MNSPQVATLNRMAEQPAAAPGEQGDTQASDWGLAPEKPGFSRENKFVLFVLLILVAVFSYVVFRNFQKKGEKQDLAKAETKEGGESKDTEKGDAGSDDSETKPNAGKNNKKGEESTDSPTLEEPPQVKDDPFGEEVEPPAKTTAHRGTKQRGASLATDEEIALNEEVVEEPPVTKARSRVADPQTPFDAEAPVEELESVEPKLASRPRGRTTQVDELEGAEPAESATVTTDDATFVDDANATVQSRQDVNFEQTGGVTDDGMSRRIGKKSRVDVEDPNALAQTGTSAFPDEVGTVPSQSQGQRTGNRVAAPPSPRNRRPAAVSSGLDPAEDKFGGLVPQDVTQPSAPGRGGFDTQADPLVNNTGDYTIRPNDNYWRISRKVYGTSRYFDALRKHNENNVADPKNMKVGDRISTPSRELLEQQYRDILPVIGKPKPPGAVFDSPTAPKTPGYFVEPGNQPAYRVGPTDTLSSISQRTLGRSSRWDEIYELNKDRIHGHDQLSVGTILRLPADASQPRLVGTPTANQ